MEPQHFKAPFIPVSEIWREADDFRNKIWPSQKIPIDVLSVVEFDLGLEIRPISKLKEEADVDALLLGDWQTIVVDQNLYMDNRYTSRLRYSIAHELGHYVLHRGVFSQIPQGSFAEWIAFMRDLPEKEYSFLEYHANEFAGRFLVPPDALRLELEVAIKIAGQCGLTRNQLRDEVHMQYLAKPISRKFEVSSSVIERRLPKEKLWPLA